MKIIKTLLLTIFCLVWQTACTTANKENIAVNNPPSASSASANNSSSASSETKAAADDNSISQLENNAVSNKNAANSSPEKAAVSNSKIVKFDKGATSAIYHENLEPGGVYKFIVAAKKNQVMTVRAGSDSGEVIFDISHNGKVIPTSVDTDKWADQLPEDGDYQINVRRRNGKGRFVIEIFVE